jgi:glycosyltransferase involved in cell wall biosynthesis
MSQVSVIIPNYNREVLIAATINNLLAQTQPPQEIIVVDDGSTDGSIAVIRSFGARIKLIQQANQGPGAARNAGLALATGDYIQFQDSDDLLSLNKLEAQTKRLEETGADIAFSPWAHIFIRDQQVTLQTCILQQSLPPASVSLKGWLLRGWFTVFQSLLFRRSFLLGAARYETDVRYGEDMEFLFRLLAGSPRVVFVANTLTLYRLNSDNNLSQDGGASQNRRVLDWARCVQRIGRQAQSRGQNADGFSRAIFLANLRKHLRYLRAVPDAPPDLIRELDGQVARWPGCFLAALEFWLRFSERLRLWRCGQRWMAGLQAGSPTPQQFKLMDDLGFEVGPAVNNP